MKTFSYQISIIFGVLSPIIDILSSFLHESTNILFILDNNLFIVSPINQRNFIYLNMNTRLSHEIAFLMGMRVIDRIFNVCIKASRVFKRYNS